MQYILTEQEYSILKGNSKALEEINQIVMAASEDDEHGNSEPYAYRFDRTIKAIINVLDSRTKEISEGWRMPWSGRVSSN